MTRGDEDILALLATNLDYYFELLVTAYAHRLKAFAFRQAGSLQDAEDIVQEAFVRAYYALVSYSPERVLALKVRPWLYKITWSVFCNYVERSKQPPLLPLDLSEDSEIFEREDNQREQPEMMLEYVESRSELLALVDALPQRYREVVSLHYFEELSYQEIANIFSQPVGTVRVSVHRGIGLLRKAMDLEKNKVSDGA